MTNPVVFSSFISKYICSYIDNVDNPDFASTILDRQGEESIRYNALYDFPFEFVGDNAVSRALSLPGVQSTDWVVIVADVIGSGEVTVAGLDFDNTTPLTGRLRGSGNSTYPGKIYYGGYNVTGVTLLSKEDSTIIRGHVIVVCSATDVRYPVS